MSAIRPRNADDLTPAELATAAIDMDRVLEREPQLSDNGFKRFDRHRARVEQDADFLKWREDLREPRSLARFMAARGWLGNSARSGRSTGVGRAMASSIVQRTTSVT